MVHLLVAENNFILCRRYCEAAISFGVQVHTCNPETRALYARLEQLHPYAVLVDVGTHGVDGVALKCAYDAAWPEHETLFYAISSYVDDDQQQSLSSAGYRFCFVKPFDMEQLFGRIFGNTLSNVRGRFIFTFYEQAGVPCCLPSGFVFEYLKLAVDQAIKTACSLEDAMDAAAVQTGHPLEVVGQKLAEHCRQISSELGFEVSSQDWVSRILDAIRFQLELPVDMAIKKLSCPLG